jgi:hypothetical protein
MNSRRAKILETILVLVIAFIVLTWVFNTNYLLITALVIGCIGLFIPGLAEKIHWFWQKLSHVLGTIMNFIILSLIYIAVLLPLAFLSRALLKLTIRLKPGGESYFRERNFKYTKESMEKMW